MEIVHRQYLQVLVNAGSEPGGHLLARGADQVSAEKRQQRFGGRQAQPGQQQHRKSGGVSTQQRARDLSRQPRLRQRGGAVDEHEQHDHRQRAGGWGDHAKQGGVPHRSRPRVEVDCAQAAPSRQA